MTHKPVATNPIRNVVAIDGGYTEVPVQTGFPSSAVCFFQIGALIFSIDDLEGLDNLTNIEKLKCDMYDSALIPVALANKLVSLADHPSSGILQKFAKSTIRA